MSVTTPDLEAPSGVPQEQTTSPKAQNSTFARVAKYTLLKMVSIFFSVVVAVYLTILIANMGGYVDQIVRGQIREFIGQQLRADQNYQQMDPAAKNAFFLAQVERAEKRYGLDKPFVVRSLTFLWNAIRLDFGTAQLMASDTGSRQVRLIILDRLGPTLLLVGASNLILFFGSIALALMLSRSYGNFWDKLIIAFSPTSSAPSWFYGLFLILLFAAVLKWLPFGGMIDSPPPRDQWGYILNVGKHLILPTAAIITSSIFISIYNWRTFFLIYSSEDYVEMAKAKGLSARDIQYRYILRPTLPTIITSFALLVIGLWTGLILTEGVFQWPGLGRTYITAIGLYDTPVIVAITIIYAYLLALTVFLLDFVYALVDPRVKIGE
ncbi:MAG: ABC transporter permease [Anaerolineales bacterium]|nr:ABC transporter permease [Anaerolineales bacterium]